MSKYTSIVINSFGLYTGALPDKPYRQPNQCLDGECCYGGPCLYQKKLKEYEQALATALLPENMVRFEDQDSVIGFFSCDDPEGCDLGCTSERSCKKIKDGIYPLPSGYEIVTQWQYNEEDGKGWINCTYEERESYFQTRQVAKLVKKEEQLSTSPNARIKVINSSTPNPEKKLVRWEKHYSDGTVEFTNEQSTQNFIDNLNSIGGIIASRSYIQMRPVEWEFKKLTAYDESLPPSGATDHTSEKHYLIIGGWIHEPIGCCSESGRKDVIEEEPKATFQEIEIEKCPICNEDEPVNTTEEGAEESLRKYLFGRLGKEDDGRPTSDLWRVFEATHDEQPQVNLIMAAMDEYKKLK